MNRTLRLALVFGVAAVVTMAGRAGVPAQAQAGVIVDEGVQYAAPDGQPLLMDIYRPSGPGPFAAVVLVHGGGWQFGERGNLADYAQYLAENGLAAFTIDYRLANTHRSTYAPYPAAVIDIRTAIRWVRDHANTYDLDPKELGLLGSSAGAHLVQLVGFDAEGALDQGDRVKAIVSWSGPPDLSEVYRDAAKDAVDGVVNFTNCHDGLPACQEIFDKASPLTYVDKDDPPLFFANGTDELVPLVGALELNQALGKAGVPHVLAQIPGTFHAQHYLDETSEDLPSGKTIKVASLAWLQAWLLHGGAGAEASPTPSPAASKGGAGISGFLGLVGAGALILGFGAVATRLTMRRRNRRAAREREWREGQRRYRRSSSGSRSRSGSRSGSGSRPRSD